MTALEHYKELITQMNKQVKGPPTFEQLNEYRTVAMVIYKECKNKFAFEISKYVKSWCDILYKQLKKDEYSALFWDVMKWESNYLLDSYMIYLEKDRPEKERFYLPRRKQLLKHGLVQALQDIEDDKYDILTISLPPGTGKAQPLYSKVLTPNGFVEMGTVKVGDTVISASGKKSKVLGVYQQGVKDIYEIILENGLKCRCSAEHLWNVRYNYFGNKFREETVELNQILFCPYKYFIPVTTSDIDGIYWLRVGVIQKVSEEECQCIYIDDESHLYITDDYIITHNTTFEKFFLSWVIGKHPEMYNLFYSHSDGITRMFYDGVLDIVTNPEYKFSDIFPNVKLIKTDAKSQQLTFNNYKPFPNLQTGTIESNLAGKVRCNGYLLCDDLIGKMEQALNKVYLDKLWEVKYTGDAKQRKMTGCKEIHIATRWSVHDIIGRIMALLDGNKKTKFISVDCYDENHESQFDYDYGVGLSTEFLHEQELFMDDISFKCLYRNEPIEREGLLYHEEDIRRYSSLPLREPDAIIGICDTKNKGTDFLFFPCFYKYDEDYYLVDCVCSDGSDYEIQYQNCANLIIRNNMQMCEFESNNGGDRVSHEVNKLVSKLGGRCNITNKATETNKETRIIVNAPWIKQHVLFKDKDDYTPKSDYGIMMSWLFRYSVVGKNPHDDIPDGLANFALFVTRGSRIARVEPAKNPYRRY